MASRFMIRNKSLETLNFNQFSLEPGGSTVVESREMHNDPSYAKYLALQKIVLVEYVESEVTKEMNGKGMIKRGVISSTVPAVEDKPAAPEKKEEEEEPAAVAPVEETIVSSIEEVVAPSTEEMITSSTEEVITTSTEEVIAPSTEEVVTPSTEESVTPKKKGKKNR